MKESTRQRYISHYTNAVSAFVREVGDVNAAGIREVHLPLWGNEYDNTSLRIAFIGRDSDGWGNMPDFLNQAKQDIQATIFRKEQLFLALPFTKWTNNFGTSFFDTVLRYLAFFHQIPKWKELKKGQHKNILQSFVWAQTNTVEKWETIPKQNKPDHDSWKRIKASSEQHLDSFSAFLDVFQPHVAIIMNWELSNNYWGRSLKWERIGDHVNYAYDDINCTHVFNTAHPTWLNFNKKRRQVFEIICDKWQWVMAAES